jgi:hypothetical protein
MLVTTETLLEKGFKDQIIKEWDFAAIFRGTPARRYALIHKALKKGEIEQLYRGKYILGSKYRSKNISKYFIASRMIPGSYVSFETALSFHGWIPEKVNIIRNTIEKGRTRSFTTTLGEFEYIKIPVHQYEFLTGVCRKELDNKPFLVAAPLRALMDYVYINKIEWSDINFLLEGMRIEQEDLEALTTIEFNDLMTVYTSKRVHHFLSCLKKALEK